MNINKAYEFVKENAREVDLAFYEYYYENESKEKVIEKLKKYQNVDGGFGHGLEADNFNPHSSPICTNDALIMLYRIKGIDKNSEMIKGIIKYLNSCDSFDESQKKWLFAVESNKDYPHAVWWEKKGDGISGFNPTISLATFMYLYSDNKEYYKYIILDGFNYLETEKEINGDELKCFLLSYEMLKDNSDFIIDLDKAFRLLSNIIERTICKDFDKYGIEYVLAPSDIFCGMYLEFINDSIFELVNKEMEILGKLQKDDGGFDITWKWYNDYKEFEIARKWWRPRITIDKLLFYKKNKAL